MAITTQDAALSAEVRVHYDKKLLVTAMPLLQHAQFFDKFPIPRGEAEAVFRAAQLERDLTQRDQFGAADRTETAAKALTARYPQMDAETVRDLLDAGRPDRAEAAAQRTHTQATKAAERTIADYNAKRATAPRPVEGVGGGVGGTRSVANMSDAEFLEYDKQLTRAAVRG